MIVSSSGTCAEKQEEMIKVLLEKGRETSD